MNIQVVTLLSFGSDRNKIAKGTVMSILTTFSNVLHCHQLFLGDWDIQVVNFPLLLKCYYEIT